jgi:transposase
VTDPESATRNALRALARRFRALDLELAAHVALLTALTAAAAPDLVAEYGVGPDTASALLVTAGDNRARVRGEAALAAICGASPIPASSGRTNRHRLNRGGDRQANAALHRVVLVRMRSHAPTLAYVARRTAEGKSKPEIMRCLRRYLVRELWPLLRPAAEGPQPVELAS